MNELLVISDKTFTNILSALGGFIVAVITALIALMNSRSIKEYIKQRGLFNKSRAITIATIVSDLKEEIRLQKIATEATIIQYEAKLLKLDEELRILRTTVITLTEKTAIAETRVASLERENHILLQRLSESH